jgi:dTDP-4-amino-4,6-dideoxy-D-galactose acyltransferase
MINPFDRFHSDIAIAPADADRMMEAWVEASITGGFADVTVVPDVPVPQAFCTARLHRDHWQGWGVHLAQPVLSAVAPVHKGWYVRIISELGEQLRQSGATHAFLVTQLTNNAVIRCWEKLGYQFGKGEHVMRKLL